MEAVYCGVTYGTLDRSEFDRALLAANVAMREAADPDRPLHPNQCGPCGDCAEFLAGERARRSYRVLAGTPTAEQFHRHARRFGPERVEETAAQYGIDLRLRREQEVVKPKRQRRMSAALKADFARLYFTERKVLDVVADVLNISDRRAAALRAELAAAGWHRNDTVTAVDFSKPQNERLEQAVSEGEIG